MPLDPRARQFFQGQGPVRTVKGGEVKGAENAHAAYRKREFLERAGSLYEDLMGFFLQQKRSSGYLDDEAIGAVALFTINLRESFGTPQSDAEKKTWSPEKREQKLAEFDAICEQMQQYYDENT